MSDETTPKLWQVLEAAVAKGARGIRTGLPGRIEAYDAATNRATVQALVPDGFFGEDGSRAALPIAPMTDVPVAQIGWGSVRIKAPIRKGTPCWLMFSSSCLVGWKHAGDRVVDPQDDRRHHDADVVAWPAMFIDPTDDAAMIEFTEGGLIKAGGDEPLVTRAEFLGHTHATAGTGPPTPPTAITPPGSSVTFPGTSKLRG